MKTALTILAVLWGVSALVVAIAVLVESLRRNRELLMSVFGMAEQEPSEQPLPEYLLWLERRHDWQDTPSTPD